uniref:XF1762 family protein n=1 Tax=Intestinibacillus massiliensis TaxID=1871029 RepID=UPI0038B30442
MKHIELADANAFVAEHHRHHKPVRGHRFSLACYDNSDRLCGVAIVGRPVARNIDQHNTVEVLRMCTDGTRNACSILYAACRRSARELGYERIITYILDSEPGVSLRAAGWEFERIAGGGSWSSPSRPREDSAPTCRKQLYQSVLRRAIA